VAQEKELKKMDGKVKNRVSGIVKLDDANWAGGPKRAQCTLILTEGDSAKSMAIAGLSVVGRDKYGVFPLRGKLLNVKDVTLKRLMENEEIINIKTILGLESGKIYQSSSELRYGRIMIMTDQDVDGSHIKGLIFNLFETLWPSLLRAPDFLVSMLTPIVKVDGSSFYTLQDFERWRLAHPASKAKIKYYKGLGTSTSAEAKQYFKDMTLVRYACDDPACSEALDLAFNKSRSDDRKRWLEGYARNQVLVYGPDTRVSFSSFVNKDLIHFSKYDLERSIPHVQDGLKVSQRKILFTCFGRPASKESKVFMLAAAVAEAAAYHHGDASLYTTIVGMAQDFVGSNNLNLLEPIGQFGTRRMGGKDAASSRYICTRPSDLCNLVFRPEDRSVLKYLEDDGMTVEPEFYVPIVPMILFNGAAGIGMGFSTNIPCYDPLEVIRALIRDDYDAFDHMIPHYRGFKGQILKGPQPGKFITSGVAIRIGPRTVRVTELAVGQWTEDFKALLEEKIENGTLTRYDAQYTDLDVDFTLTYPSADALDGLDILLDLKMRSSLSINNMHLFNANMQIKCYKTIREIVEEFAAIRLVYYAKRRAHMLQLLKMEINVMNNKVRFISEFVQGTLIIGKRKIQDVHNELTRKKYAEVEGSFDYLLRMPMSSLTLERMQKLESEVMEHSNNIKYFEEISDRALWVKELKELEARYSL
jgi:DNA topoisomerase-2